MTVRRSAAGHIVISAWAALMLAGCAQTPLGPTVQSTPGPGKSFDQFATDKANCKSYAAGQVQGEAEAANQQAVSTAGLSAVLSGGSANTQSSIQQEYDNAYSQCMYSKGDQVPGYAPVAVVPSSGPAPDPLVRSTQSELIRLGYLQDVADGYMGPKTRGAISSFEQSNGLAVDGSPSPTLLARLQSTPSGAPAPTAAPTASAPSNWVAPAGSPAAAPSAGSAGAAPSNWVAPAGSPGAAPPPGQPAAAPSSGWVSPSKTP